MYKISSEIVDEQEKDKFTLRPTGGKGKGIAFVSEDRMVEVRLKCCSEFDENDKRYIHLWSALIDILTLVSKV